MAKPSRETMPPPAVTEPDRLDRIEALLRCRRQSPCQYREWFQFGLSQTAAHFGAFNKHTQIHEQNLVTTVEKLA
jgi:hypothetical protein